MKQLKVLLVGCGDIGTYLGQQLTAQGHEVTGVRRTPPADAPFNMVSADLLKPESLAALKGDYDFVVYTATPSESTPEAYDATYVQGLQHLMNAIAPPKERLLLVSSTGVYHQSKGEWVDETSDTAPARFSGKTLLKSEALALQQWPNTTVVRFSGIYGPGRVRLIKKVQQGCEVLDNPPVYTNRIHRDDCAGVLSFLMTKQQEGVVLNSVYIGTDHEPATNKEVLDFVASELNLPLPVRTQPEDVAAVKQNKRCKNQSLIDLGYQFKYPSYKEGYGEMIAALAE